MLHHMTLRLGDRVGRLRQRLLPPVTWTRPTSTEIGTVAKSGLAAGLAWSIAALSTSASGAVLAPLTAIVVVQVSVRASISNAFERSATVVLGVLIALGVGNALHLNGITVAVVVALTLGVAQLVLRLPPSAARQVPVTALVVLSAATSSQQNSGWERVLDTVIGASVGVVVSVVLPASRLVDARQTLGRLADGLGGLLETMGMGLREPWSTEQTVEWRRTARSVRDHTVDQAVEAVGNGRDAVRWNVRDRRHLDVLGRYEDVMPRLERAAIGVSVMSRGLDDHARLSGSTHKPMQSMGALLISLGHAVRAVVNDVVDQTHGADVVEAMSDVHERRADCVHGASLRAKLALGEDRSELSDVDELEGEWLSYAALLVQVDRIVADHSAPLST